MAEWSDVGVPLLGGDPVLRINKQFSAGEMAGLKKRLEEGIEQVYSVRFPDYKKKEADWYNIAFESPSTPLTIKIRYTTVCDSEPAEATASMPCELDLEIELEGYKKSKTTGLKEELGVLFGDLGL